MTNEQLIILLAGIASIITAVGAIVAKIKICNSKCSNCVQDTTVQPAPTPQPDIEAPTPAVKTATPIPRVVFPTN